MDNLAEDKEYLKNLTLLYVEDDEITREQFAYCLPLPHKTLITAVNGEEGLSAWHNHKPDIVITDIQMPVMDGLSMAEKIREADRSVPIIVFTAFDRPDYFQKAINIGVDSFVTKPLDPKQLQDALFRCAHRLRGEEELKKARAESALRHINESLNAIVDCMSDWVWEVDSDGRYIYCSPQIEAVLGYTPDEVIGKFPFQFMPPEEAQRLEHTFIELAQLKGKIVNLESWNIARDGRRVLLSTTAVPVFDAEGNLSGYRGVDSDITDIWLKNETTRAQLHLVQYSQEHTLDELFVEALNIAENLTASSIAFFHLLEDDQVTLRLQSWSSGTSATFCKAKVDISHYCISRAGVWVDAVRQRTPVIHNDYASLPDRKGMPEGHAEVIRELLVPVIRGEKIKAVIGVGNKSTDYVSKDTDVVFTIADMVWEIAERMINAEKLVANERFLSMLTENIPELLSYWGADYRCRFANKAYLEWFGKSMDEMIGISSRELLGETLYLKHEPYIIRAFQGEPQKFENSIKKPSGETIHIMINYLPDIVDGTLRGLFLYAIDITEQKQAAAEKLKLESQLHQSQKMEAIGQLAGGVAHDFNNILSVIGGYCGLMRMDGRLDAEQSEQLAMIESSGKRAAELTGSLLAFSRNQEMIYANVNLNDIVNHVQKFLTRIIGEDIRLTSISQRMNLPVNVDSGQIEQVLINLATNARDAMPEGGELTIKTDQVEIDSAFVGSHGYGTLGRYAVITVSDTGTGIDREQQKRIFEPFFTTKEVGKGTGLGMAIVFGIIQQHSGFIDLTSEPGSGTSFNIFIPLVEPEAPVSTGKKAPEKPRGGNETILLVEDDATLRKMVTIMLKKYGYGVIEAIDGEDAIAKFSENRDSISMVLMDIIMPKKNGRDAYSEICRLKPDIKALFTSGYTGDFIRNRGVSEEGIELIRKPVQPNELMTKIREILDRRG